MRTADARTNGISQAGRAVIVSNPSPRSEEISDADLRFAIVNHGAIAGASVAAVIQLAGREQLSSLLLISLACFALAIPSALIVVLLFRFRYRDQPLAGPLKPLSKPWPDLRYIVVLQDVNYVACFGGFLALFSHFHLLTGGIFLFASALAFTIGIVASRRRAKPPDG